jgi:hypothetical protein
MRIPMRVSPKFITRSSYEEGHERRQVKEYAPYFLGSVIINSEEGNNWVIDAQ